MQFKDFQDLKLSALGFGAMRLPVLENGIINEEMADEMVSYAFEHGVNYFDTAYPYHSGDSERIIGRALKQYPRESYYLATKYPGHQISDNYDPAAIFEEQLKKCGVEYFDFYLLHNVYENSIKVYTDPQWGIVDYFLEQKKKGRIKYFGFSTHAGIETLEEFLDQYGNVMDFGQIQLNYLDWTLQDAKAKYELLTERGIPVWVMEPVRGGTLAKDFGGNEDRLKLLRPNESIASWGFRWLQALPNVTVILSGMSNMEQVQDNVKTFGTDIPLSDEEKDLLAEIASGMLDLLPCTACRYCCDGCPKGLNIPIFLGYYNELKFSPTAFNVGMSVDALPSEKQPSACIECGKCVQICPQNIDIPKALKELAAIIEKLPHWSDICKEREKAQR